MQPFYCPITSRLRFQKINEDDISGARKTVKMPAFLGIIFREMGNLPEFLEDGF